MFGMSYYAFESFDIHIKQKKFFRKYFRMFFFFQKPYFVQLLFNLIFCYYLHISWFYTIYKQLTIVMNASFHNDSAGGRGVRGVINWYYTLYESRWNFFNNFIRKTKILIIFVKKYSNYYPLSKVPTHIAATYIAAQYAG